MTVTPSLIDLQLQSSESKVILERDFHSLKKEVDDNISKTEFAKYNKYGAVNICPALPHFDDIKHKLDTKIPQVALIPVAICEVDRSYDREVNWSNIRAYIEKETGFSFDSCVVIDVVYDRKRNKFIVVIGQHRVVMNMCCLGFLSHIPAKITLLDESIKPSEQIKIEAEKHNSEANNTTAQKPHERGLSAYISDDKDIKRYVDFCIAHNVGVKGTEHLFEEKFTKVCETAWAVGRAMKISTLNCGIGLDLLRDYLDGKKLDGKSIVAITQFTTYFDEKLTEVAKANGKTKEIFLQEVFNHSFNACGNTTEDWLDGTSVFRGEATVIPVARLVKMTNLYCKAKKLDLGDGRKSTAKCKWIKASDAIWVKFLNKTKTHNLMRPMANNVLDNM